MTRIFHSKSALTVVSCAVLFLAAHPLLGQGVANCSPEYVADAVPLTRTESAPGDKIHPTDLTGKVTFRPVSSIDPARDSTGWNTLSFPTAQSGYEMFQDVISVGSRSGPGVAVERWVFALYSNGLQVWDLNVNPNFNPPRGPEYPVRLEFEDLFAQDWFYNPGHGGEIDQFLRSLDVLKLDNGTYLVATAGRAPTGVSFWVFDPNGPTGDKLRQSFEDLSVEAFQIRLFVSGGRAYAIAGTLQGTEVYDATQAVSEGPCKIEPNTQTCSGAIKRGKLADSTKGRYVDVIQRSGKNYVVIGETNSFNDVDAEIWELPDPSRPEQVPGGTAIPRYTGSDSHNVFGPTFFEKNGKYYLAVIKMVQFGNNDLRIYDVTNCLDDNGCTSLGALQAEEDLKFFISSDYFLTPSWSGGELYLHTGLSADVLNSFQGSGLERLWRVSLPAAKNQLPEVTDTSDSYPDPCHGKQVDYFGDYLPGNDYGLNRFSPKRARFNGPYFYRAATGLFDIHVLGEGSVPTEDPTIKTQLSKSGGGLAGDEFWFDDSVELDTVVLNCLAEVGAWCWSVEPDNVAVSFSPNPECDQSYTSSQTYSFQCDSANRCDDTVAGISAWNMACGAAGNDSTIEQMVKLKDPTIEIDGIETGGTSFAQCQVVPMSANVLGRGPVEFRWELDGEPIDGCSGSVSQTSDLSESAFECNLDTSGVTFGPELFFDGFESGSCGFWNSSSGGSCAGAQATLAGATRKNGSLRAKAGANLRADLILTNGTQQVDSAMVLIDITEIGDPVFADPQNPIEPPVVAGSAAILSAPALQTSEWIWEIEDPTGTASCTFGASQKACKIVSTFTDSVEHGWLSAGTYRFNVRIANCQSTSNVSATGSVEVMEAAAPTVTGFNLSLESLNSGACCGNPLSGFQCRSGQEAIFTVTTAEEGSFNFGFDWELEGGETPNFTAQTPDGSNATVFTFTHTFSNGSQGKNVYPTVRSSNGILESILQSGHAPIEVVSSCN